MTQKSMDKALEWMMKTDPEGQIENVQADRDIFCYRYGYENGVEDTELHNQKSENQSLPEGLGKIDQHKKDIQPFENYSELAKHIKRMANTGVTDNLGEWSEFLRELNNTISYLEESCMETAREGIHGDEIVWDNALDKAYEYLTPEKLNEQTKFEIEEILRNELGEMLKNNK